MKKTKNFQKNLKLFVGSLDDYCIGYSGEGNYLCGLILTIGSFKRKSYSPQYRKLEAIMAFDQAEIASSYVGQVNMVFLSSFCGPQGLLWGYDLGREESLPLPSFISEKTIQKFEKLGITLKNGENLRKATLALLGTRNEKHFPFLPGTHLPCAGGIHTISGPTYLYGAMAIGIPKNREKSAAVLMEDAGEISYPPVSEIQKVQEEIIADNIFTILEIGKSHQINFKEVFVDFVMKKIKWNEIGCVVEIMPYFLLAKKAFCPGLPNITLSEWLKKTKRYFQEKGK